MTKFMIHHWHSKDTCTTKITNQLRDVLLRKKLFFYWMLSKLPPNAPPPPNHQFGQLVQFFSQKTLNADLVTTWNQEMLAHLSKKDWEGFQANSNELWWNDMNERWTITNLDRKTQWQKDRRSGQVYWVKQTEPSINCKKVQLYPSEELSQITSRQGENPSTQWQSINCINSQNT